MCWEINFISSLSKLWSKIILICLKSFKIFFKSKSSFILLKLLSNNFLNIFCWGQHNFTQHPNFMSQMQHLSEFLTLIVLCLLISWLKDFYFYKFCLYNMLFYFSNLNTLLCSLLIRPMKNDLANYKTKLCSEIG